MLMFFSALGLLTSAFVAGQRPFFAGTRPIGFPETPNRTTTVNPLADRFGEGTTERLPIEANGDRDLIDRLSKLPLDKQPFWFINWQALEENRRNPQTYPQRPNVFVDPVPQNPNPVTVNTRFNTPDPGFISTNAAIPINRFDPTTNQPGGVPLINRPSPTTTNPAIFSNNNVVTKTNSFSFHTTSSFASQYNYFSTYPQAPQTDTVPKGRRDFF